MFKPLLNAIFKKDPSLEAGRALYAAAVEQARSAPLYEQLGAEDTVEGRFEQVALHVYLVMRRLKTEPGARETSQCMFDAMFQNMDDSLREMGVGDDAVGKKVRKMAESFHGRIAAFEDALAPNAEPAELERALGRNLFANEQAAAAPKFAAYVRKLDAALHGQPHGRVAKGIVVFPPMEELI
ncbi:ubiquinol-cytochrome C chaperone family protein [Hyphococcus lacteus]|uniref:Ubiquinol-cytochrome C chaperone family protein n=1 Tax=Hyphococcus lacteus TaxID=3143536 RepID=A0ABV3Z6Z6_9PROT